MSICVAVKGLTSKSVSFYFVAKAANSLIFENDIPRKASTIHKESILESQYASQINQSKFQKNQNSILTKK